VGHRLLKRTGQKKRVTITLPLKVFREFRAFAIGRGVSQARAGELIIVECLIRCDGDLIKLCYPRKGKR